MLQVKHPGESGTLRILIVWHIVAHLFRGMCGYMYMGLHIFSYFGSPEEGTKLNLGSRFQRNQLHEFFLFSFLIDSKPFVIENT